MKITYDDILNLVTLARELDSKILLQPILPLGRAKVLLKDKLIIKLNKDKTINLVNKFIETAIKAYEIYPDGIFIHAPPALIARYGLKYLKMAHRKCPYKNMLAVLWDGSIAPCAIGISHPETIIGNIKKDSIIDIWLHPKGYLAMRYVKPEDFIGVCSRCIFNKYCAGFCIAYSYETYGDYKFSNPYCQLMYDADLFPREFLL
ncbi:SPASM domain-containing protein [Vulcanisaeta distributa]|uniref:SPASM domain-containing protein n=1 Tax=Vulcanisaeta distributa TaxID=164451 RepID=UPI0006D0B925|nr:SPASM domain-containing protein [Vulcanisaeta distributa]